jgi:hypothetical protein
MYNPPRAFSRLKKFPSAYGRSESASMRLSGSPGFRLIRENRHALSGVSPWFAAQGERYSTQAEASPKTG